MNKGVRYAASVGLLGLLFCQYYFLFSGRFGCFFCDDMGSWVPFPIIFLTVPANILFLLHVAFMKSVRVKRVGTYIALFCPLINGPLFGIWSEKREEESYRKHGVKTAGIVTDAFCSSGRRMYYKFHTDSGWYSSSNVMNPLRHSIGDSVMVIYNARCPEMNSAIENCEGWDK